VLSRRCYYEQQAQLPSSGGVRSTGTKSASPPKCCRCLEDRASTCALLLLLAAGHVLQRLGAGTNSTNALDAARIITVVLRWISPARSRLVSLEQEADDQRRGAAQVLHTVTPCEPEKRGPAEKNQFRWWGRSAVLRRVWRSVQTNKYRSCSALAIFLQSLVSLNLRPLFREDSTDAVSHKIWCCLSLLGGSASKKVHLRQTTNTFFRLILQNT
jgi:hypothetical protein